MRIFTCLVLLFGSLNAYYDVLLTLDHPYWADAEYLITTKGEFTGDDESDQRLQYGYWYAKAGYTLCVGHLTGLVLRGGYSDLLMQWNNSPFFSENHFPSVDVSVGAFTACVDRWLWKALLEASFQTTKFSPGRYTLYTGVLWGRYAYSDCFGLHVGAYATLGVHKGFYRPIFGFDWQPWSKVCIKAVYPIDMEINYCFTPTLSVAAAARFTRERRRLDDKQPVPEGMFEYRAWGGEGRVTWRPFPCVWGEIFVGSFVSGWIRTRNSCDDRIGYSDLKGNGYAGGHLEVRF
jgi:hypothetical protein